MMQSIKCLSVMFLLFFVGSCGFSPVLKSDNGTARKFLSRIKVEPINSVEGVDFYNHIKTLFPYGEDTKYTLFVTQSYSFDSSIIQKNSDILRETVEIRISYILKEISTQKIITSGDFSRLSSYNTNFPPYNNYVNQQDIKKNLSVASAEEVRNRVMLFIKNKENNI